MDIYFEIIIFLIGIIFGSFFNVCIFRIPNNKSISYPPSHCYRCNTRLKGIDLMPILSWLLLKGKCRYCKSKISIRYPLIELLTGIVFVAIYKSYGFNLMLVYYLVLASILIIITFIDIDFYIIPDSLIIIGLIFGIAFKVLNHMSIIQGVLGLLVCGGGMYILISFIENVVKKEVMGGGDIKLFAMIGFFLGVRLGLLTILLSIYVGAIYGVITITYSKLKLKSYNSIMPYGPFISIAAFISIIYGENIIKWYVRIFMM